jgi:hypothetical protein
MIASLLPQQFSSDGWAGPDTSEWPEREQAVFVRLVGYLDETDISHAANYLNVLLSFLRNGKY